MIPPPARHATRHPYAGKRAVLATMHGKAAAIAPALARSPGLEVETVASLDTDALGTFTGETPRAGDMRDAAIAKARLGMAAARCAIGIASEGSFGPHPMVPFIAAATELLVLVDDDLGLIVQETMISERTNFAHIAIGQDGEALAQFLAGLGFPSHAVVVRPNEGPGPVRKGLVDGDEVSRAVSEAASASTDRLARIETDMRAHLNPTRMAEIARLAERFAARLARLCPACGAPGFGAVSTQPGLPCALCGAPTGLVKAVISGCMCCTHTVTEGRSDGLAAASPANCPECNP